MKYKSENTTNQEIAILSSIFLEPKHIEFLRDELEPKDFFDNKTKTIYKAMLKVEQIDLQSIMYELQSSNANIDIDYMLTLVDAAPTFKFENVEQWVKIVKKEALKRTLIEITTNAGKSLTNGADLTSSIEILKKEIIKIENSTTKQDFINIGDVLEEVENQIEINATKKGGITGFQTGYKELDRITSGLQKEELIILAARPAMGKSAFALNLALNINELNGNASVAILSLEMGASQLANRMISNKGNIESLRIKNGTMQPQDYANFKAIKNKLKTRNIFFDSSNSVDIREIMSKCRLLKRDNKLDILIVDYLQLISSRVGGNRQQEVAHISRSLKQLAMELKIPIVALSQLSRAVELREDKRPVLSDLRESGSIEQDADMVWFLYRHDYYEKRKENHDNSVELNIAKNRSGISGVRLGYYFEAEYSRFRERENEWNKN